VETTTQYIFRTHKTRPIKLWKNIRIKTGAKMELHAGV
jgi:hypothetical protein